MIFGWGYQTVKDYGQYNRAGLPFGNLTCPNCHNVADWHPIRIRLWFTFFFIPYIPYSTKYWLTCPVCGVGIRLSRRDVKEATEGLVRWMNYGELGLGNVMKISNKGVSA